MTAVQLVTAWPSSARELVAAVTDVTGIDGTSGGKQIGQICTHHA